MTVKNHFFMFACFSLQILSTAGSLWCFQCSWKADDQWGSNAVNCSNQEINEVKIGPPDPNPQMNPTCKGKFEPGLYNATGYEVLKTGCYPSACATKGGVNGRCGQWKFYLNGGVINTTLFCGISADIGCFTEEKEDGYTLETCLCNDKNWCNGVEKVKVSFIMIILIFVVNNYI